MTDTFDLAARLLDAHVAHELDQLEPSRLPELIEREVTALFSWLGETKLDGVVTRDQVTGVIDRYVIELKISGALTELAGEMSRLVMASKLSEQTRIDQVLEPAEFTQFADKLTGLPKLWRELLHLVLHSDAFASLLSTTVQRSVLDAVFREPDGATRQTLVDGLLAKLRPVITRRVEPYVSAYLEKLIKHSIERSEQRLIAAFDVEAARGLVDEVWDEIAPMKLAEAFKLVSSHDLEDFVVLGYEFWQRYRKTRYFREISRELVDYFFTKYADASLLDLLDEVGVTAAMVSFELQGLLPPLLEHARASGTLERHIRAHLERFYRSDAAAAIFASLAR